MGTIKKSSAVKELQESENAKRSLENLVAISDDMAEKVEDKKEQTKKTQLVNLNLNKDKYDSYKKMFGASGYNFAQGTRMCLDFIQREIEDGCLELTESGFRKTVLTRIR